MRSILLLGAGRSASSLLQYLIEHAAEQEWHITVAERDIAIVQKLTQGRDDVATPVELDASDAEARGALIGKHDLVISMLPFSRWRSARRRITGSHTLSISIADCTRVCTPNCSSAFCMASAFMTVASIPI